MDSDPVPARSSREAAVKSVPLRSRSVGSCVAVVRARCAVVATVSAVMALLLPRPADAEFVDPTFWVTDGIVYSVAVAGDTLYAGGTFQYVGPNTGGFAAVGATTGARCGGWPRVDGNVLTMASDGAGGWYIGGSFQRVAGVARGNLAHIRADGTLDGWDPGANSTVYRLVVSGSTVYACGLFTSVGGQVRVYLAALDATTGLATGWNPVPNAYVYTLSVSGSTVYVGGNFSSVGGQARSCIAALDAATGLATAWNPGGNYDVGTIVPHGSTIYVAGGFTHIGGQVRYELAALDSATGLATSWAPSDYGQGVSAIAVTHSTVYVGHLTLRDFFGGRRDARTITALDVTTGQPTGWRAGVDSAYALNGSAYDHVSQIVVRGSTIYVAGEFGSIGYRSRSNLAALDATTGLATDWNPGTNGAVCALALAGDTAFAGGHFRSACGWMPSALAAFDLTTDAATAWNPAIHDVSVLSLVARGPTIYVGCGWWSQAGPLHGPLGAIDAATGLVTDWHPGADHSVYALAANDSVVFAGGYFGSIGGQTHPYLAALDATTGLTTDWSPDANGTVRALAWSGATLIAGGAFSQLGGQVRARIAALDASTGLTTSWNPGADNEVDALFVDGSTVYAGGRFSIAGGQPRTGIAALDASTGLATSWNPGTAGTQLGVSAIAAIGSAVYAGGTFTTMGGKPRRYLAALDATTGLATSWDPAADGPVYSLAASGPTLFAGGGVQSIGGRAVSGLARILPTPTSPPQIGVLEPNGGECVINNTICQVRWSALASTPGVESVDLYLSRSGPGGPWRLIAAGAPNSGVYAWSVDGSIEAGNCYLRADARDYAGTVSSDVSDAAFTLTSGALGANPQAGVAAFTLGPVRPNPVRGAARLEYALLRPGPMWLTLIDVQGREVRVLAEREQGAGRHTASLDTGELRPGLYFVRLRSGEAERSRRIVVVR